MSEKERFTQKIDLLLALVDSEHNKFDAYQAQMMCRIVRELQELTGNQELFLQQ